MTASVLPQPGGGETMKAVTVYKLDPYREEALLTEKEVSELMSHKKVRKNLTSDAGVLHLLRRMLVTLQHHTRVVNHLSIEKGELQERYQSLRNAPTRSDHSQQLETKRLITENLVLTQLVNHMRIHGFDEYAEHLYEKWEQFKPQGR